MFKLYVFILAAVLGFAAATPAAAPEAKAEPWVIQGTGYYPGYNAGLVRSAVYPGYTGYAVPAAVPAALPYNNLYPYKNYVWKK